MASPTPWTWIWANSQRQWRTGNWTQALNNNKPWHQNSNQQIWVTKSNFFFLLLFISSGFTCSQGASCRVAFHPELQTRVPGVKHLPQAAQLRGLCADTASAHCNLERRLQENSAPSPAKEKPIKQPGPQSMAQSLCSWVQAWTEAEIKLPTFTGS